MHQGALVKCRKVGAANWGNSTRKSVEVGEAKMESGYISNVGQAEVRYRKQFGKKCSGEPTGYFGRGTSAKANLL